MKKQILSKRKLLIGALFLSQLFVSTSIIAQTAASNDATDSYTDNQSWSWTIDDNNNQPPGFFRWWKDGGNNWQDLLMELSNPGAIDSKLKIFQQTGSAILQLSAAQNGGENGNPYLLFDRSGNSNSKAAIFVDNHRFLSFSNNTSAQYNKGFRFFNGNGLEYPVEGIDPNYGTELMRIGEDGKVNIGPASAQTALNLQVTGVGYNQPKFGLSSQYNTWDHFYISNSDTGPILRAGGAENGIDFQIGVSATGTYDDSSQNYTSKFQIYPNKIETKTQEVTFNYGGTTDLTKVSINTDKKVDHAALTIAGATYIGPKAELSASNSNEKFKPEYLEKYNLWVEDGIVTQDIAIVALNEWRDMVFSNDYDLKPLEELETYVKANKHLPGIKSEEQVKKEGYTVKEMDIVLLEKVEELTLYIIEQNKKINSLTQKLELLEKSFDKQ